MTIVHPNGLVHITMYIVQISHNKGNNTTMKSSLQSCSQLSLSKKVNYYENDQAVICS